MPNSYFYDSFWSLNIHADMKKVSNLINIQQKDDKKLPSSGSVPWSLCMHEEKLRNAFEERSRK